MTSALYSFNIIKYSEAVRVQNTDVIDGITLGGNALFSNVERRGKVSTSDIIMSIQF